MKTIVPLVIITAAAIGAIAVQEQPSQAEPAPLTQEQFDGAKIQVLAEKVKALEEELAATRKQVSAIKSCECEATVKDSLPVEPKQTAPKQKTWSWDKPASGSYQPRLDPATGRIWYKLTPATRTYTSGNCANGNCAAPRWRVRK